MKIRRAGQGEHEAIARLHAASWRDSYRQYIAPDFYADLDARLAAHWQALALGPDDLLLVAERAGEPAGFVLAWDGDPFWINTLHTVPAARSHGIGGALMAEAARHFAARGRTSAWLDVIETNHRAIAFYERLGGVRGPVKAKPVGGAMVANLRIDFPDLAPMLRAGNQPPSNTNR